MAPQSKPKATKGKTATTEAPQPAAPADSQTPPPEENQAPPSSELEQSAAPSPTEGVSQTPAPPKADSNAASCILATSLATEYASYQPGDTYTATPETIQRLIDRGLAVPVTQ
ncbi:hypothetical protein [Photobacterium leiognathi]|uniref:hypothetical protein n=1 Tax=Photobacterium leiognathi TaxID=553611 RepID=UPI000D16ACAB|nr:hypothetical protein [Photobacterium leiognathi]PSW53024.1 hypothetical protein C0W50_19645 [Photobacterium leiognathi subsp. mandapamensis]